MQKIIAPKQTPTIRKTHWKLKIQQIDCAHYNPSIKAVLKLPFI